MRSLYNSTDLTFTDDALNLECAFKEEVRPMFEDMVARGFSPREISHFLATCVWDLELICVLDIKYKEAQSRNNA